MAMASPPDSRSAPDAAHQAEPVAPQPQTPQRETVVAAGRRIELIRTGARLSLRVRGLPLNEGQARVIAMRHLNPGERLLDAVNDDAADFSFVVWPRAVSHTGRLLEELRAA